MKRITDWVHDGLRRLVCPGDRVVDATLGNGHDALVLAECVGESGRVWGFDVQAAAIASTRQRLSGARCFSAFQADHARLSEHLPKEARGTLRTVVFNLGYLPGGEHRIVTRPESTLSALATSLDWLAPGGVLCCTCYRGRPEEADEAEAVTSWFAALPASSGWLTRIERLGARTPPPLFFWLEKSGKRRQSDPSPPLR